MSIVQYTVSEKARDEYPHRIVSPPQPSPCCVESNRERVGGVEVEDGEAYFYKRCRCCGHTVRFFFPLRYKSTNYEQIVLLTRAGETLH